MNGDSRPRLSGAGSILFIGKLSKFCGNRSFASRIKGYFESRGCHCLMRHKDSLKGVKDVERLVEEQRVWCIVGIHALHAGALLQECSVPYVLIFGGTDLNENVHNPDHLMTMTRAVTTARYLVAFNSLMAKTATDLWPDVAHKIIIITQGVSLSHPGLYSLDICQEFDLRHLAKEVYFFTLVAGIRPVKDPLYLVQAFSNWHQVHRRTAYLLIIGPEVDPDYTKMFHRVVEKSPGVLHLGSLSEADTQSIIRQSYALVNTSVSEGMCLSILEAMQLHTLVLARNIPANEAIVKDNQTGLLFSTPEEFLTEAEEVICNPALRSRLVHNAHEYVIKEHNCDNEKAAYTEILTKLEER